MSSQYLVQPPSIPMFLYKFYPAVTLRKLIEWSKQEHLARLRYCAENGYYKELKRLNEDYSPMMVLAELNGFRKIASRVVQNVRGWNELSGRERVFVRRAYEIRNFLFRTAKVAR